MWARRARAVHSVLPLLVLPLFLPNCAAWSCARFDLDEPIEYKLLQSSYPLCLQVPAVQGSRGVYVEAQVLDEAGAARVCLKGEFIINSRTPSSALKELADCGEGRVQLQLLAPSQTMSYVIVPSVTAVGVDSPRIRIAARYAEASAPEGRPLPPEVPSRGRLPAGIPPSPPPRRGGYCLPAESTFMAMCAEDRERLCPDVTSPQRIMKILAEDREHVTQECLEAMHKFSECLYGPQLLVPMEIASFLLLATASVVLFCTLLRCCCRYVCVPSRSGDAASEASAADEHDDIEDDEPTVTPLPTGVTHANVKLEERTLVEADPDEEEALPTYTEVIDGSKKKARM